MDRETVLTPLSREWFENLLTMVDSEGRGIPGLSVEQAMAEIEPHLPAMTGAVEPSEEAVDLLAAHIVHANTGRADPAEAWDAMLEDAIDNYSGELPSSAVKARLKAQEILRHAYAIDRPAPVVGVKELEWDGQTLECEVCAAEPYLGPRYAVLPSDGGFLVRTGTGAGYFDGSRKHEAVEAAKAACEAQWQTSVRQLLTATTRDEVERETRQYIKDRAEKEVAQIKANIRSHKGSAS